MFKYPYLGSQNPFLTLSPSPCKGLPTTFTFFSLIQEKVASFSFFGCSHRISITSMRARHGGSARIEASTVSQIPEANYNAIVSALKPNAKLCPTSGRGSWCLRVSLALTGISSGKQMKQEMECVAFFSLPAGLVRCTSLDQLFWHAIRFLLSVLRAFSLRIPLLVIFWYYCSNMWYLPYLNRHIRTSGRFSRSESAKMHGEPKSSSIGTHSRSYHDLRVLGSSLHSVLE